MKGERDSGPLKIILKYAKKELAEAPTQENIVNLEALKAEYEREYEEARLFVPGQHGSNKEKGTPSIFRTWKIITRRKAALENFFKKMEKNA